MTTQDLIDLLQTLPPTATCLVRLTVDHEPDDHEILDAVYEQGEVTTRFDEPVDLTESLDERA